MDEKQHCEHCEKRISMTKENQPTPPAYQFPEQEYKFPNTLSTEAAGLLEGLSRMLNFHMFKHYILYSCSPEFLAEVWKDDPDYTPGKWEESDETLERARELVAALRAADKALSAFQKVACFPKGFGEPGYGEDIYEGDE